MQISKKTILFLSALGIFSGCSDDPVVEQTQSSGIKKAATPSDQKTIAPKTTKTVKNDFVNFKDLSDKQLSRGFDIRPAGLSATVLRLGNVLLKSDGTLSIFPTPSYTDGTLSSAAWNYETRFQGIGRNAISPLPMLGTTLSGKRVVMNHQLLDVEYEHRTSGLEQFITVNDRPPGEGKLHVAFSLPDTFEYELSTKKDSVSVSHNGEIVFNWSNLYTHDAKGNTLASLMRLEDGNIIYEVDDTNATYPIVIDPLANTPNTTLTATDPGTEFGIAVDGAGDVNNDGFDDIIVGEFEYTGGNNQEGRALIFPGSPSGISATALWAVEGGANFAKFGVEVVGIGDINNDGFDDFAVGAELAGAFEGRAYVYLGGAIPSTIPVFTAVPPAPLGLPNIEAFGANITAGDFNCDGRTDLAVAGHLYDGPGAGNDWGRVLVYNGDASAQLFDGAAPLQLDAPASETYFGDSLESGNFNGDSVGVNACDDLVVGQSRLSLGGSARRGRVSIYFGAAGGITTAGWTVEGNSKDNRFGFGTGVGEANNDGLDDLVIGGYHAESGGIGTAKLYVGNSNAGLMSTTPVWSVDGDANAKFGRDVDILDADNNGFGDILVTAEKHIFSAGLTEGAVFIYFNASGTPATTPLWSETEGANANSNYGWNGGSAGDVNGDGFEDVFVGAFGTDDLPTSPLGNAYVYHGSRTCLIGGMVVAPGDINPLNPCEICDPDTVTTSYTGVADGTSCDDDNKCTNNDVCQLGVCGGAVETCNDNNPCTDESCNPATGCLFLTAPEDGNSCADDGDSCTADLCSNGVCTHPIDSNSCFIDNTCYPAGASDPSAPCMQCNPLVSKTSFTAATAGAACDDGLFCTTGETCDAVGQCSGAPRDCSNLDGPCVASVTCNENTDQCLVASLEPIDTPCNTNDLCSVGTCGVGGICNATNPVDCSSLDGPCSAGVCDMATGMCSSAPSPDGSACDDGDACTVNTTCQAGTCAQPVAVDCNDGNDCTIDSCNSSSGCINTPASNGSMCDDGDLCTVNATCQAGNCTPGTAKDCDDGNECTNNFCNAADGACLSSTLPDNTPCDDGVTCTVESCQLGSCMAVVNPGFCSIAQTCIADGMSDPASVCRVCDSSQSTTSFSDIAAGTSCSPTTCNPTQTGTQTSDCDGNGGCILQPVSDCGSYLCDTAQDTCFTACLDQTQCETGANCTSDGVTPGVCITGKPTAVIGGPTSGNCEEELTLDASASLDPNGLAITYNWTQLAGPDVLTNVITTNSTLVLTLPSVMEMPTLFRFQVVVSNGAFDSDPQEWIISGIECPTQMDPDSDMGNADASGDVSNDVANDVSNDVSPKPDSGSDLSDSDMAPTSDIGTDTSDSDLTSELHGSGCLCSSTSDFPTDASWILLLAFFGFRRRNKK